MGEPFFWWCGRCREDLQGGTLCSHPPPRHICQRQRPLVPTYRHKLHRSRFIFLALIRNRLKSLRVSVRTITSGFKLKDFIGNQLKFYLDKNSILKKIFFESKKGLVKIKLFLYFCQDEKVKKKSWKQRQL